MLDAKLVADLITATRAVLGLVIAWLGLTQGESSLPAIVLLILLDWTGDFVDGGIAHRSRYPRRTRIGDSDIYVDLSVSICLGIFLVSAGYVGFTVGFWYAISWMLLLWRFGLDKNLLMLAQTPIYLWFIIVALRVVPQMGYWMIIWVAVALSINWRRFSKDIVPKFIHGMASMFRGRHS